MMPSALLATALLAISTPGAGQAVSSAPLANTQLAESQSIADSDAPMAGDMRHQVRSRIAAGESPEEVRAWLVERYGDYVSYRPGLDSATWPLFALPVLFLLVAGAILFRRLGRRGE